MKITVGNVVTIFDETIEETATFTLVAQDKSNLSEGKLSVFSPLGASLLGLKLGDRAKVSIFQRSSSFLVLMIGSLQNHPE